MQVQCTVLGATLRGVEAIPVQVEVLVSNGLPAFSIVGMPDAAIQEARERVRAAIRACGFTMPNEKVVVNLAPGSLKKTGAGFDLPMAVGLLIATKQIPPEALERKLIVGELSLEGQVRPVNGLLAYALCARDLGQDLICAEADDGMVSLEGVEQYHVGSLSDFRVGEFRQARRRVKPAALRGPDYKEIAGNDFAKRALQIAAAGNHGVLLMGPPGSGKTMLASRLPSILPPLTEQESLESALVHSVVEGDASAALAGIRPFRSPHHSASTVGLVGGGNPVRPGEISLAHNGILFLDELPEFKGSTLQAIRQPMESGTIVITRAEGNIVFPARFMLVAASNPCPCGYYGDKEIRCTCSLPQIQAYQNRIGGPLMDRIDIHLNVGRSDPRTVLRTGEGVSSASMRESVRVAWEYARYRKQRSGSPDAAGTSGDLLKSCKLSPGDGDYLEEMAGVYHMSGRGIMRCLSVARTIADMEEAEKVGRAHLCEALAFRLQEGIGDL